LLPLRIRNPGNPYSPPMPSRPHVPQIGPQRRGVPASKEKFTMTYPDIFAALARERSATVLAEAEAARWTVEGRAR
jgi:hypothetical protein